MIDERSTIKDQRRLRLLISAGEASGDMHGGSLLGALRRLAAPDEVECFGMGGECLRANGCQTVVDAKDVAVVGLVEVLSHLPGIYRRFRQLLDEVDRRRPDAAVLIDFPEFNFRLARQLHRRGIPVVYYISPQFWAWNKGRVKLVRRYVRKMLVIFPFERDFYRRHGIEARFVGHPLAERELETTRPFASRKGGAPAPDDASASKTHSTQIALLPGSRHKEIELNLPAMLEAARLLHERHPELHFRLPVASTVSRPWLEKLLRGFQPAEGTAGIRRGGGQLPLELAEDAAQTLAGSRAAVVASGTATLEAALAGTPFVMVYRLAPLTWLVGRFLVDVPFFCIVNLIAGRGIVTELVQRDFTPENVTGQIEALLPDGPERQRMLLDLAGIRAKLRGESGLSASEHAAREVLAVMRGAQAETAAVSLELPD
ncbi:MAG: lipid-A-disaccharide synthase [Candidatus Korobacteraceae bacterium]